MDAATYISRYLNHFNKQVLIVMAKQKAGRPSLYKEEYNEQARKLCLLGATDKELANFFEVDESTINNWKKGHPTFLESIRAGKTVADMEIVNSLYKSAQDRLIPAYQAFKTRNVYFDDKGNRIETEKVEVVEVPQAVPANDRAIKFWLNNRQPSKWRDKQEAPEEETNDHIVNVTIVHRNQDDD